MGARFNSIFYKFYSFLMLVICVTVLALKAEMLASCADLWASKEVASVSILAGLSSHLVKAMF